jgi:hypothetical protein
LIHEGRAGLVMQPAELLKDLSMIRLMGKDTVVGISRVLVLHVSDAAIKAYTQSTHIAVLLIDVSELEPNIP